MSRNLLSILRHLRRLTRVFLTLFCGVYCSDFFCFLRPHYFLIFTDYKKLRTLFTPFTVVSLPFVVIILC